MKNSHWIITLLTGVMAVCCSISLDAQDWPQWRGENRDGVVNGFIAPENWPPKITLQWKDSIGTGDATPVLVDDRLFVFSRQGDKEVILCLDAHSGEEQWRNEYEAPPVTGPGARHPGPRSTPAVSDGKIVALGASGILSCLDASSGKLLWRKDPFPGKVPMFFTSMSPLIEEGICIAYLGSADDGALIAYDINNGNEKWRWNEEGPDYGSPILMKVEGMIQVVTLTAKSIIGVNLADGKLQWKLPFLPERRAYNAATPIIVENKVIFTGAGRGTKAISIGKQGGEFVAGELWSNPDLAVQFNTPVLKEGLLYGYSNTGRLFCMDAQTGETAWRDTIPHERSGFASIVDAGPVLMALPGNSELIVIEPERSSYTELAKIKVADLPTYAHPVLAGNRLYVRDEKTLALWELQ